MKKTFINSILLFAVVLFIFGFGIQNRDSYKHVMPAVSIIECAPGIAPGSKPSVNSFDPDAALVRKNVYGLSSIEIAALKLGIKKMKLLSITNPSDPTGWAYQAAIHGTFQTPQRQSWNSCQHGTLFFLSWHRMYLYFFERILRFKANSPTLTLPYWDYQITAQRRLPAIYRSPANATTNPLYESSRFSLINSNSNTAGQYSVISPSISVAINHSLDEKCFFRFQTLLENPHGAIHTSIGGKMTVQKTAAEDPLFWAHHANIDRLWEVWLNKHQGRNSPSSGPWMTQLFTFFDYDGTPWTKTGADIIRIATQLNYRYQSPASATIPNLPRAHCPDAATPSTLLKYATTLLISTGATRIPLQNATLVSTATIGPSDRVYIDLDSMMITKLPEGIVEVYLLPGATGLLSPGSNSFANLLDLFTLPMTHDHDKKDYAARIDITNAIRSQDISFAGLQKATLVFLVRGNSLGGTEVKTSAAITISGINVVLEKEN